MAKLNPILQPETGDEAIQLKIQRFVLDVQIALQKAMQSNCITQQELAHRLGKTPGRISQMFSERGCNLTLETVARVADALGEEFELARKADPKSSNAEKSVAEVYFIGGMEIGSRKSRWEDTTANQSLVPSLKVA